MQNLDVRNNVKRLYPVPNAGKGIWNAIKASQGAFGPHSDEPTLYKSMFPWSLQCFAVCADDSDFLPVEPYEVPILPVSEPSS